MGRMETDGQLTMRSAARLDVNFDRGAIMKAMSDITGFVLAGGKSTRMGRDKAFLDFAGETLLARAIRMASNVAPVRIVGAVEKFAPYGEIVSDVFAERGPLGGIHAALRSSATELNLVLGVDMPFVIVELLFYMVEQARACDALVCAPRVDETFQPLCAVYRRGFADIAERALREGRNKVGSLFTPEVTRTIEQAELEIRGFTGHMFENLNTPEELERASLSAARRTVQQS
jgi:molybdopterin-guanine dinucleotide biosynthesis protein A